MRDNLAYFLKSVNSHTGKSGYFHNSLKLFHPQKIRPGKDKGDKAYYKYKKQLVSLYYRHELLSIHNNFLKTVRHM